VNNVKIEIVKDMEVCHALCARSGLLPIAIFAIQILHGAAANWLAVNDFG
jgi:hypothetical protein